MLPLALKQQYAWALANMVWVKVIASLVSSSDDDKIQGKFIEYIC